MNLIVTPPVFPLSDSAGFTRPCSRRRGNAGMLQTCARLDASKLSFQVLAAEQQRGRPTMRAVMRVVDQITLGHQGGNLLRAEAVQYDQKPRQEFVCMA